MKNNKTLFITAALLFLLNGSLAHAGLFSKFKKSSDDKTVTNSLLEYSEKVSSGVKYIMVKMSKDQKPVVLLTDVHQGVYKIKLALQEGSGIYDISIYQNKTSDRNAQYEFVKSFTVDNTDSRDVSFLLPTQKVQSDDPRIIELTKSLTKNAQSKEEAFHAIYNYVTKNIAYDRASRADGSYAIKDYNALQALNEGRTVCDGYSSLIAAMARVIGIRVKVVFGTAKISATATGRHAWNEVYLNDEWQMVDATFDAGRKFQSFYLMDEDQFNTTHFKEEVMPY